MVVATLGPQAGYGQRVSCSQQKKLLHLGFLIYISEIVWKFLKKLIFFRIEFSFEHYTQTGTGI